VKLPGLVVAALLIVGISGCADGGSARPAPGEQTASARPAPSSPAVSVPPARVVNGIVINELDVMAGTEPRKTTDAVAALGGIVIGHNEQLGTYQVRFQTHSLAELTRIKDELAAEYISANLVFAHAPLP
jgi:hypothetical protein